MFQRPSIAGIVCLLMGALACSKAPSGPTEVPVEVKGLVSDGAFVSVQDALVTLQSTSSTIVTRTDAEGRFTAQVPALAGARLEMTVTKPGFETDKRALLVTPQRRVTGTNVTLRALTQVSFSGRYGFTLVPDTNCPAFPGGFTERQYIGTWQDQPQGATWQRLVLEGSFVDRYGEIHAAAGAEFVRFDFSRPTPDFESDMIGERIGQRGYFAFWGSALGRVDPSPSVVEMSFTGRIEYCPEAADDSHYLSCSPATRITCHSTTHRLRLTPR